MQSVVSTIGEGTRTRVSGGLCVSRAHFIHFDSEFDRVRRQTAGIRDSRQGIALAVKGVKGAAIDTIGHHHQHAPPLVVRRYHHCHQFKFTHSTHSHSSYTTTARSCALFLSLIDLSHTLIGSCKIGGTQIPM